jgi:Ca2+-binding EF-hand superfamily protein
MTKAEWNTDMSADEVKLFKARDTNHDGVVSLAEAIAYSKKMKTYDATIKEADKNKDGFISREEAVAFYADKAGPVR